MLIPLEAEVESLHASSAAFLRPQSSSLRDHQHPAARDRARLFDSERFKRKFVTTLARPARRAGLPHRRIRSHPAERDCHLLLWPSDGANPTQIMQPARSAGPAVRPCGSSSDAASCRAANRTIRFRLGPAPNTASGNLQAAPSKPRRGGKAARLESEPSATLPQPLFNDSMMQ
jgi:hypothetical protein